MLSIYIVPYIYPVASICSIHILKYLYSLFIYLPYIWCIHILQHIYAHYSNCKVRIDLKLGETFYQYINILSAIFTNFSIECFLTFILLLISLVLLLPLLPLLLIKRIILLLLLLLLLQNSHRLFKYSWQFYSFNFFLCLISIPCLLAS